MALPLEKLLAVKTIITHKACADGVASAIFLHDVLPDAQIRFIQYGTDERLNLKPEPNMLFCDFSPHPSNYKLFIEAGALILDHHKGEQAMVAEFGDNGVFGDEVGHPGVCGAYLAYREVWTRLHGADAASLGVARPIDGKRLGFAVDLARLAGIRDTWQTKDPDWVRGSAIAEVMRFYPEESWLIDDAFGEAQREWWDKRLATGAILAEKTSQAVYNAVKSAHRFTTPKGTRVIMFSGLRLSSDAAELVDQDADLVIGFDYVGVENGVASLVFSTRSHTGFNCLAFCKAHAGGGHTAAAGCSVKFDPKVATLDPYTTFERLLVAYEDRE